MARPPLTSGTWNDEAGDSAEEAPVVAGGLLDLGPLGEGATSEVRRARDVSLERNVAVKVLRSVLSDRAEAVARFLGEARVTAALQHPGVVPVYAMGRDSEEHWFFTMKEVSGVTLTDAIRRFRLGETAWSQRRLVEAVRRACETVAYAHASGVIHRDLKPDNIMLGEFGEVYVLDWGLARAEADATAATGDASQTQAGAVMGTPAYMSPEQAAGRQGAVEPRSDVFGLGAVLFAVLSGRPPLSAPSIEALLARAREGQSDALAPDAPPELASIVARAMQPAPGDRYPSALALGDDLGAWLAGGAVSSHTYGWSERAWRWAHHNRRALSFGGLSLALVTVVSIGAFVRTESARQTAVLAREDADRSASEARGSLATNYTERAFASALDDLHGDAAIFAVAALQLQELPRARGALLMAGIGQLPVVLREHHTGGWCRGLVVDDGAVECTTYGGALRRYPVDDAQPAGEWATGLVEPHTFARTPGGKVRLAASRHPSEPRIAWVHEGQDPTYTHRLGSVHALAFAAGRFWSLEGAGVVRVWDPATRREVARFSTVADARVLTVGVATVMTGGDDSGLRTWDHAGAPVPGPGGGFALARVLAVTDNGQRAAAGHGFASKAELWVATSNGERRLPWPAPVTALAFHPDRRHLAVGDSAGRVSVFDTDTDRVLARFTTHADRLDQLAWSADGRLLAATGFQASLRIMDVAAALRSTLWDAHAGMVRAVSLSAKGDVLASLGGDGLLRAWSVANRSAQWSADVDSGPQTGSTRRGLWWTPDGRVLATEHASGAVILDGETGRSLGVLPGAQDPGLDVLLLPDGDTVLQIGEAPGLARSSLSRPGAPELLAAPGWASVMTSMALHPAGVAVTGDQQVGLYDLAAGTWRMRGFAPDRLWDLCVLDTRIAAAGLDGVIRVWDPAADSVAEWSGHLAPIGAIARSPDRRWVASASADRIVQLRNADRGSVRAEWVAPAAVNELVFSASAGELYGALVDGRIQSWSLSGVETDAAELAATLSLSTRLGLRDGRIAVQGIGGLEIVPAPGG